MGTPKSPMTLRSCKQRKEPAVPTFHLPPVFLPFLYLPGTLLKPRVHQELMTACTPTVPASLLPLSLACPGPTFSLSLVSPRGELALPGSLLDLGAE